MPSNNKLVKKILWIFSLSTIALLSGCSHTPTKDGPPNFYVDETKIPNAVPKYEPLSRSGNMDHYSVFGKRYNIMRTSRNYEEVGIASWYGTKFHSHHTSNGERYNMLAMTAAHKTLPLPTYVQVTNLKNNKKVIVKVNDRGPFESNRLIDLSYVAAKKLGMLGHGTTYVDVKSVDPRDMPDYAIRFAKNTPERLSNDFTITSNGEAKSTTQVAAAAPTTVNDYLRYAHTTHKNHYAKLNTATNKHHYQHVASLHHKTHAGSSKTHIASKKHHTHINQFKEVASASHTNKSTKATID